MARHVPPGVPTTVLLVEHRLDDRSMYADYLQHHGFKLVEAATTDEGLRRAADVDIVVTGIRVAGSFDGLELVRRLRANSPTAAKLVIVLTAWALNPAREQALAAGCDRFLAKPCLPQTLVHEIRSALRAAGSRPSRARRTRKPAGKTTRRVKR